tara:strand:+ start:1445 stop:3082 length:1638 start_codon:yes stop_codon:yes gene_type:complete
MIKPRFVVGPPGTGKTHTFLLEKYREFFKKYDPDKIVLISHTNVAVSEILNAAMDIPEIKERGYRRKFFEDRICTIHHYCKKKLDRKEVFTEQDNEDFKNLCRLHVAFAYATIGDDPYKDHPFFKFIKASYGHDRTLEEHWHHRDTNTLDYSPYSLIQIQELKVVYEKYKDDNNLYDFADMITKYNDRSDLPEDHKKKIRSDIEVLMVDEAQDTNRPQLRAVFKMAKNVRDDHFYMIGDPDQTIFEWAGSDAHYFHQAAAKPWLELTEGKRCGEAINKFCKQIIAPVWRRYNYNRKWLPVPGIVGNKYELADLQPSLGLEKLLEKIKNTKETFIFAYRGKPSDKRMRKFFEQYGIEYAHIKSSAHVSLKELKCHDEWPSFTEGAPKSLKQIKDFWCYLGSKAIVHGKGTYKFEDWVNQDYTINTLIDGGFLKSQAKEIKFFDLLRKRAKGQDAKQHERRMIYIRKVIKNGFDFDGKIRVKYGNIHQIKGTTFDNVVGDLSIFRRGKREHPHIELRLKYTMFSRGIYDAWVLRSETERSLGEHGSL